MRETQDKAILGNGMGCYLYIRIRFIPLRILSKYLCRNLERNRWKCISRFFLKIKFVSFDSFETVPIASGSLAQVHRAFYKGREVAIKVFSGNTLP
jgi:hypothetical protein